MFLRAAQPEPNDRGEINASLPGLALRRAALKRATWSPTGEMRVRSADEQFAGKSLAQPANMRLPGKFSSMAFHFGVAVDPT